MQPIRVAACLLISLLSMSLRAGPAVNADAFNALPQDRRFEVLLAGLRTRDTLLRNFAYSLVESRDIIDSSKGSRTPGDVVTMNFRRVGDQNLMHVQKRPPNSELIKTEFTVSWNGKEQLSSTSRLGGPPQGVIRDVESEFVETRYHALLGYRQAGARKTLPDWLEELVEQKTGQVDVSAVVEGEQSLIRLAIIEQSRPTTTFEWCFDPTATFAAKKHQVTSRNRDGVGRWYMEVQETKMHGEVGIPTKVLVSANLPGIPISNELLLRLTAFEIGTVKEDEVRFSTPPGTTLLVNESEKTAVRIKPDGTREEVPYLDERAEKKAK